MERGKELEDWKKRSRFNYSDLLLNHRQVLYISVICNGGGPPPSGHISSRPPPRSPVRLHGSLLAGPGHIGIVANM